MKTADDTTEGLRNAGLAVIALGVVVIWSAVVTLVLGLGITLVTPMRVTEAEELAQMASETSPVGI